MINESKCVQNCILTPMRRRVGIEPSNDFCSNFFSHSHTVIFTFIALDILTVCTTNVKIVLNYPCMRLTNSLTSSLLGALYIENLLYPKLQITSLTVVVTKGN